MTWDQARMLEDRGVDFGPHTVSHYVVFSLNSINARCQIEIGWRRLLMELRRPLPVFAWPTGRPSDFLPWDIEIVRNLGLSTTMAVADDYSTFDNLEQWPFALRRLALPHNVTDLLQYATSIERAKQKIRR